MKARHLIAGIAVAAASGLGAVTLKAQGSSAPAAPSASSEPVLVRPARVTPFITGSTVFDTNINHDVEDTDSYGMVLGLGALVKNDAVRPTFELQYQAGFHRYANTDRWNRLSQYVRAAWERRLHRRLAFEAVGEGSLKGSTEDQELSNQAVASPRLEFRFTRALRIRGVGVWRLKRYDDTPDRNATNRYAGVELLGRPLSGRAWTAGARYETNDAESARQSYDRWTWYAAVSTPVGRRDRLNVEGRVRQQRYPYRLIERADGSRALRRDMRVEPEMSWVHVLDPDLDVRLGYAFNGRNSNDPDRDYTSHQFIFSIVQRF